jgi:DNA-binding IclR family transcriptional regulator
MTPVGVTAPLQTVDRALEVLLSFSEYRQEWGVLELSEAYDIPRSSAQRLLAALANRGFLIADPRTRRYGLGPAVWRMAALWERSGGLATLVTPILAQLSESSGRTSVFGVPDGAHVRCVAAVSGQEGPRRSHPYLDELYPANAGATSRGYFAFLDAGERYALLHGRPFARFSGLTAVDENELEQLFDETVKQGYAFSEGEWDESTRAIAVPVFSGHRPVGSLTLVENKSAEHPTLIREYLDQLKSAADAITGRLSNRPPAAPRQDWRRRASQRPAL